MANSSRKKRLPQPPLLPGPALRTLVHLAESQEQVARSAMLDCRGNSAGKRRDQARFNIAEATADGIKRALREFKDFIRSYEEFYRAFHKIIPTAKPDPRVAAALDSIRNCPNAVVKSAEELKEQFPPKESDHA